jgi:hypothetical protein
MPSPPSPSLSFRLSLVLCFGIAVTEGKVGFRMVVRTICFFITHFRLMTVKHEYVIYQHPQYEDTSDISVRHETVSAYRFSSLS